MGEALPLSTRFRFVSACERENEPRTTKHETLNTNHEPLPPRAGQIFAAGIIARPAATVL